MRKIFAGSSAALVLVAVAAASFLPGDVEPRPVDALRARIARRHVAPVEHARFDALKRTFSSPQQVTEACISCHNGRHLEVMRSSHWTWERAEHIEGRGVRYVGKRNLLNNFCIGIAGSEASCNKCHVGYGWSDASFDFEDPRNVDCLACHDGSGSYVKANGGAGRPDPSLDLARIAQRVARPQRGTCGACHFFGGGGNNVKHGDLESALLDTTRQVDVHMGTDGGDLSCADCHTADGHQIKGKLYSVSSMNRNRATCEQCHGGTPHAAGVLNEHTLKVACQTCHIPSYAKVNSTKLRWDWSTAGRLRDSRPYAEKDALGNDSYLSTKGSFEWGRELRPEYVWFNGTAGHYLLGDRVTRTPVPINSLFGSYEDRDAKIVPVKVHRSRQPYDEQNAVLVQPKLAGQAPGDGALWRDFDWNRAAAAGMALVGQPYSGRLGFVETEMSWPLNHMVAPKEQAVGCSECHTRRGSRLASVAGFYLPGRDRNRLVDGGGTIAIALSLLGALVHGTARVVASRRRRESVDACGRRERSVRQ